MLPELFLGNLDGVGVLNIKGSESRYVEFVKI